MIYRVHITCKAGHKTYTDYKTSQAANKRLKAGDIDGWIATHIELNPDNKPLDKMQRINAYISGCGLVVYEAEQYDQRADGWYIVGDSSNSLEFITAMIDRHNELLTLSQH